MSCASGSENDQRLSEEALVEHAPPPPPRGSTSISLEGSTYFSRDGPRLIKRPGSLPAAKACPW